MGKRRRLIVTLGELHEGVNARLRSGVHTSSSEVRRADLSALEREETAIKAVLREKVQEALNNPSPMIPADAVLAELRAHRARGSKADNGSA